MSALVLTKDQIKKLFPNPPVSVIDCRQSENQQQEKTILNNEYSLTDSADDENIKPSKRARKMIKSEKKTEHRSYPMKAIRVGLFLLGIYYVCITLEHHIFAHIRF